MSLTLKQRVGVWVFDGSPITRFLIEQLRVELRAAVVSLENRFSPRKRALLSRVRAERCISANVACGPFVVDGFVNLDLYAHGPKVLTHDCRRGLPFENESVSGIRVEHF